MIEEISGFMEGARRDPWSFVGFGMLLIFTGLNWIVYRSWWAEQSSKYVGSRMFNLTLVSAAGVSSVSMGLLFAFAPLIVRLV